MRRLLPAPTMRDAGLLRDRHAVRGFTLTEMLVVTAVLAVAMAVAMPSALPLEEMAVDAAGSEVVQALRFAQADAMRAGMPRVVTVGTNNVVRVYQLRFGVSNPAEDTANPVNHPLDKKSYSVVLSELPYLKSRLATSATFRFANGTAAPALAFTASGEPVTVTGPAATDVSSLLAAAPGSAHVTIASGSARRSITVDPLTGRVTVM